MASAPRGRGFAVPKTQELRRPGGNQSLRENDKPFSQQRSMVDEYNFWKLCDQTDRLSLQPSPENAVSPCVYYAKSSYFAAEDLEKFVDQEKFDTLCEEIVKLSLQTSPKTDLAPCAENVKSLCTTAEDLEKFVENLFQYGLRSKWNAHAVGLFAQYNGDITVKEAKFRTILLRQLQGLYMERNKSHLDVDQFLLDATLACEIFHHVRIDDNCIKILVHPIVEYFCMLVDGGSVKEIEVFMEQFPKCYDPVRIIDSNGMDMLISSMRKQILAETTTLTVKAMLLEMFEMILTAFKPLSAHGKIFYESLSKPIIRVCNQR